MYKKAKIKGKNSLQDIHAKEWTSFYTELVSSKAIHARTSSKKIRSHYHRFCLNHLTKFIDLVK